MACVIVGGGYGGVTMALKLQKKRRSFILISADDYFHHNIAAVRAVTTPGWAEKTLIPLAPCFGDSFKKGKVVNIIPPPPPGDEEGKVVLESGEEISYKYLVIATGAIHKWPIKLSGMDKQEALDNYAKHNERVKEAKSVVIIGGGATGVEIAAEMAHFHPQKEITLIHNSNSLLHPGLTERSQNKLQDVLGREMRVKFVLNERVSNLDDLPITGPGTITTDKGTSIQADVLFKSIGLKVATDAFKDALVSCMTDRGTLKVDEYFHVTGHNNIFAIGDCTNIEEAKMAAYAGKHGEAMAQTILNLDKGKGPVEYKPDSLPILTGVSLGPEKGFARTKSDWKLPSFMIKQMKSKKLFTVQWWSDMKQTMPRS